MTEIFSHHVPKHAKTKAHKSSPVLSPLPLLHVVYKWLPSRVQFNSAHFRISTVAITATPFYVQEFIKLEVWKFIRVLKLHLHTKEKGESWKNRKKNYKDGRIGAQTVVSRQTPAKKRGRETGIKKGSREGKERTQVHFYYNITSPLIALITPKGK